MLSCKFTKNDSLSDFEKFTSSIVYKSKPSLVYIEDTLFLFHKNNKCSWRTKSISDELVISEVALLLAKEFSLSLNALDMEEREVFVKMLLEFRDYCIDAVESLNKSQSSEDSLIVRSEALLAATNEAFKIEQSWFYNKEFIRDAIKKVLVVEVNGNSWLGFHSSCWVVENQDVLLTRLAKYDFDVPNLIVINNTVDFYRIMVHAIDFLGYRLPSIVYAIKNHRLSSPGEAMLVGSEFIQNSPKYHYAKVMITDGENVSILYEVPDAKTKKIKTYWDTPKLPVNFSLGYRVFMVGCRNKTFEYTNATPAQINTYLRDLKNSYIGVHTYPK